VLRHTDGSAPRTAVVTFERALQIDPDNVRAYVGRGGVQVKRHELDLALADVDRGIESFIGRVWRPPRRIDKAALRSRDRLGRSWQCGTVQLDIVLPNRLDASYVGPDGSHDLPLHRDPT
jgi:hypothetical protein